MPRAIRPFALGGMDYSVVYLSSIDWDFRKQDHQLISAYLASRGHPVIFVENTGARLPARRDLTRIGARISNVARTARETDRGPAGVEVVSPLCIPGPQSGVERLVDRALLAAQLRAPLARSAGRPIVLWVALPTWVASDLVALIRPVALVYYCGDAFTQIRGLRPIAASETDVARRADVVFATSGALADHLRELGCDPQITAHPIDIAAARAALGSPSPPELRGMRGRIIGYMGGLNQKVDVDLLRAVARRFSADTLAVLGSIEDPDAVPRDVANVVVLGERPHAETGRFLVNFDVCLIPYRLNAFTRSVNPVKLLEYLAVGQRVVSTALPEVLPYADLIRIARTQDEFLSQIDSVLGTADTADARERRMARAAEHAHQTVSRRLLDVVEQAITSKAPGISRSSDW